VRLAQWNWEDEREIAGMDAVLRDEGGVMESIIDVVRASNWSRTGNSTVRRQ
jgi:hypothetical protein